ncbi:Protein CutA, partial [Lamprotornis superbus]
VLTLLVLMYPLLQGLALHLHSAVTGSYIPGTHSIAFINCLNEQIARDIARAIMDKKLAAYVNILPKSSALYFWKGELEESTEILLLVKTRTSKIGELSNYVRGEHTQLWARPPAVCGKARTQSRIPTWQKEAAGALKCGAGLGPELTPLLLRACFHFRSIHPFEIPEIISLPIDQGNPLYLKWIDENVPRD